jgi:hypothetical protein
MTIIQFPDIKKADYTLVPTSASKKVSHSGRSIIAIASQRTFLIAALGGFVSWSAMAVQMSATPLAMTGVGFSFAQATTAVEYHLLGMFVPSFFTGTLCDWLTGALLFQLGLETHHFNLGLIVVGVGWNLGYVGASALLTQSHRPEEKSKTHSLYEAIVMASISISFFSSAFIEQYFGWMILTGRLIAMYLGVAISILTIDTAFVFYKTKDIRREIGIDELDAEIS